MRWLEERTVISGKRVVLHRMIFRNTDNEIVVDYFVVSRLSLRMTEPQYYVVGASTWQRRNPNFVLEDLLEYDDDLAFTWTEACNVLKSHAERRGWGSPQG